MKTHAIKPLQRTMSAQLSAQIRERILKGIYPAGSALLQDNLAAEFGVSKIPVREALVQLSAEGLVDVFAHRGFQVRATSLAELVEVFGLRRLLEPRAVVQGAQLADAEDRAKAQAALVALNQATAAASSDVGDLNRAFHLALIAPSKQPVHAEVLGRLLTLSQRYVLTHLAEQGRGKRAQAEHSAIAQVWVDGRLNELEQAISAHIEATLRDLQRTFAPPSQGD